jgi:hypothetical protein
MTLNEYLKFEKLTRELALVKHHMNEVQTNGAYRNCVGEMNIVGWCKSEFENDLYLSTHAPSNWLQQQNHGISIWVKEQDTIAWMADFHEERFMKLYLCLFQQTTI